MENEIKVGEYVRTDNGICKVVDNVDEYVTTAQISVDFIGGMYHQVIYKNRVLKHSKNIIDLIEVGDYVNGDYVLNKVQEDKRKRKVIIAETGSYEYGEYEIENKDIKIIVTKEQFESISYKVERED